MTGQKDDRDCSETFELSPPSNIISSSFVYFLCSCCFFRYLFKSLRNIVECSISFSRTTLLFLSHSTFLLTAEASVEGFSRTATITATGLELVTVMIWAVQVLSHAGSVEQRLPCLGRARIRVTRALPRSYKAFCEAKRRNYRADCCGGTRSRRIVKRGPWDDFERGEIWESAPKGGPCDLDLVLAENRGVRGTVNQLWQSQLKGPDRLS